MRYNYFAALNMRCQPPKHKASKTETQSSQTLGHEPVPKHMVKVQYICNWS